LRTFPAARRLWDFLVPQLRLSPDLDTAVISEPVSRRFFSKPAGGRTMSSSVSSTTRANVVTVNVSGRFDFGLHSDFRKAYIDQVSKGSVVVVDLQGVDYMDSSALGMLLLLREYAEKDAEEIRIINAGGDVREILQVANFEKLFRMV
jgi:anti-anti-sigma factor